VSSDIIFVLAGGKLVEQGTHDELLAAGGLYRHLWEEQQGEAAIEVVSEIDAADALAAVPLLSHAPPAALEALARVVSRERYGAGTEVSSSDEAEARLLVVLEGELELALNGHGAQRSERLGPGDFVGELALVRDEHAPATLRTVTPVRLLSLARPDFLKVASRTPELQRAVLAQLGRRRAALASAVQASGVHESFG
jgi:CRP-like cAMP-binding protein